jgi:hypothetical protein
MLTSPKRPRIKRFRCPILTGPVRRRQSRWRRSVHGSRAETSIRCSPVRGARAPTEHPNPGVIAFSCRLWTLCLSRRASGTAEPQNKSRHRRPPPTACRLTSANNVPEHPPSTHRQLTIPGRPCCRRHAMPADWRARVLGQRYTPSRQQPLHSGGDRHHSLIWQLPTRPSVLVRQRPGRTTSSNRCLTNPIDPRPEQGRAKLRHPPHVCGPMACVAGGFTDLAVDFRLAAASPR